MNSQRAIKTTAEISSAFAIFLNIAILPHENVYKDKGDAEDYCCCKGPPA
jgi:hypothetical protein